MAATAPRMAWQSPRRASVSAAIIGNALEWYDFTVFGLFAVPLARAFFPAKTEFDSLLLAIATFGVGFVTRPIGAIAFGIYADRAGRRAALFAIMATMTVGTALIAFAPTYAQAGVVAQIILVAARLIQGFSVGGEMGSATAYLVEAAPGRWRGFYGSWQIAGQAGATLLGAAVGSVVTNVVSETGLETWAWRIPFLLGLLICPVGIYIRLRTQDSVLFTGSDRPSDMPIKALCGSQARAFLAVTGITVVGTIASYVLIIYMPTYAAAVLGLELSSSLVCLTIGAGIGLLLMPAAGALSDIIGRRRMLLLGCLGIGLSVYPLFHLLAMLPTMGMLIGVQIVFAVLIAVLAGPAPAFMAELFPVHLRSTGVSVAYSIAVMLFGGFGPAIVNWLVAVTGLKTAPAFYVMIGAAVSVVALATAPREARA